MNLYTISPFKNFKCVNKNCKHNCCIGWQINVDKRTLKKYRKIKGAFAEKLKNGVDFKGAKFKMQNGRCTFLNSDNLCEIIINLGENSLCQICRDHPRYRNFFSAFTEIGFGLCCEEAAFNLVSYPDKISPVLVSSDKKRGTRLNKKEKAFEREKLLFRQKAFDTVQDRSETIYNRVSSLLNFCGIKTEDFVKSPWKDEFLKLERLNDEWTDKLKRTNFFSLNTPQKNSVAFEQIAYYFIHRHVSAAIDETDLKSRLTFCVLSLLIINSVCSSVSNGEEYSLKVICDVARDYSAEIEYSDDNVNALLDILDGFIKVSF